MPKDEPPISDMRMHAFSLALLTSEKPQAGQPSEAADFRSHYASESTSKIFELYEEIRSCSKTYDSDFHTWING